MAAFSELKPQFDEADTSLIAASVDSLENASEVQEGTSFPVAYGVRRNQAEAIGSWWEERRAIIQPSEFILDAAGKVLFSSYSSGPVARLMPDDALKLIRFLEQQKSKQ